MVTKLTQGGARSPLRAANVEGSALNSERRARSDAPYQVSRRDFFMTTAAAGAGLMLASGAKVFGQTKSPSDKLNLALIGFGAQGRVLLESLLVIDGIQLTAIVDIWPYARTYG